MLLSASELVATAPFQSLQRKGHSEDAIDFVRQWISQTGQREMSEGTWDESHLDNCKGRAVKEARLGEVPPLLPELAFLLPGSGTLASQESGKDNRSFPAAPVAESTHWCSSQAYPGFLVSVGNKTFTFWDVISVPCSQLCKTAWITDHVLS